MLPPQDTTMVMLSLGRFISELAKRQTAVVVGNSLFLNGKGDFIMIETDVVHVYNRIDNIKQFRDFPSDVRKWYNSGADVSLM